MPLVLVLNYTSSARADQTATTACAIPYQELKAAKFDTPEYDAANESWKKCLALFSEQQRAEFAATGNAWAASLEKLPNGGWIFLMVDSDGTTAVFGSLRHATREGSVVSVWLRYEYREGQTSPANGTYKSSVGRNIYDCARVRAKTVSSTFYAENNLNGIGPSYTYEEMKVAWSPAIPGTVGDSLLDWACGAVPRAPASQK